MRTPGAPMAIVCSGLGTIRRGNETWAMTLGRQLTRAGEPVEVIGGAALGEEGMRYRVARCLSRQGWVLRWLPPPARYLWEQRTFVWSVRRLFADGWPGILHAADPQVAWWLRQAGAPQGCRVIYKDGLRLGPDWNWRFEAVQVLAPYYRESAEAAGADVRGWHVVPHFVDPEVFHPPSDRTAVRGTALGGAVPDGVPVVLAVGDLAPGSNKRIDWIVSEFARIPEADRPWLVVAGHARPEDLRRFADLHVPRLGGRLCLRPNLDLAAMPELYRAADFLVHAALNEPFGFVLIEAMASGLPVLAHRWPVSQWILGEGGEGVDMEAAGALADGVSRWMGDPDGRRRRGEAARRRVLDTFSPDGVIPQYRALYARLRAGGGGMP